MTIARWSAVREERGARTRRLQHDRIDVGRPSLRSCRCRCGIVCGGGSHPRRESYDGAEARRRWLGAVCGATYVTTVFTAIPLIGAAAAVGLTVAGQQIASLFVDRYGWFRLPKRQISRFALRRRRASARRRRRYSGFLTIVTRNGARPPGWPADAAAWPPVLSKPLS